MNFVIVKYLDFTPKGNLTEDIKEYFFDYGNQDTHEHTLDVINELRNMEIQCGSIETESFTACYCHDLGRVVSKLVKEYTQAKVQRGVKFVNENSIITSGGISSGIDMSFYIIKNLLSEDIARATAKRMEYEIKL